MDLLAKVDALMYAKVCGEKDTDLCDCERARDRSLSS